MPQKTHSRSTISICVKSLRRAQIVSSHLGETMTDFISKSADARARREVKKHNITLPADAQFETAVTTA